MGESWYTDVEGFMADDSTFLILQQHIKQAEALWSRVEDRLAVLSETTVALRTQLPALLVQVQALHERQMAQARDLERIAPVMQQLQDHETRMRDVEKSSLRLSTLSAVIAAVVGSSAPFLLKLLGI